jgi:hypothetical protein
MHKEQSSLVKLLISGAAEVAIGLGQAHFSWREMQCVERWNNVL